MASFIWKLIHQWWWLTRTFTLIPSISTVNLTIAHPVRGQTITVWASHVVLADCNPHVQCKCIHAEQKMVHWQIKTTSLAKEAKQIFFVLCWSYVIVHTFAETYSDTSSLRGWAPNLAMACNETSNFCCLFISIISQKLHHIVKPYNVYQMHKVHSFLQ